MKKDITKYNYNPISLRKMVKSDDFWRYDIKKDEITNIVECISKDFVKNKASLSKILLTRIKNKKILTVSSLYDALTIRRTNDIIKETFSITQFTRDQEIRQLVEVIKGESKNGDAIVFKSDIKSFFESIDFDSLINALYKKNQILSLTYKHLKNISEFCKLNGINGLPRGLSISSSLSEYSLRNFDCLARRLDGCIYYSRYVDDFVIVFSSEINDCFEIVNNLLKPLNMRLNYSKTEICKLSDLNNSIDFLGYHIQLDNIGKISISEKKIKKIKSRIAKSICRFIYKDNDFDLLIQRLKFLSGNSSIKVAGRKKKIFIGFKYQYSMCNEHEIISKLIILDHYFRNLIESKKYKISILLRSRLNSDQLTQLRKISFKSGYYSPIITHYNRSVISELKEAWKYV